MSDSQGAILIGGSAGSVQALMAILPNLPADFALPIIIVIHLRPDAKSIMCEIFSPRCQIPVREASDKDPIEPSTIYFAPPDYHLMVEEGFSFALCTDDPIKFSRPAVDVLFETAANVYGERAIGIILTGANDDGADGLRAICDAGGIGIIQEASSALAPQMPMAARQQCPEARMLGLSEIGEYLQHL